MSKRGESFSRSSSQDDDNLEAGNTDEDETEKLLPVMISDEYGVDGNIPIMVYVTAPVAMTEGSTFEAYVNEDKSRPFTVKVPKGGVYNGEVFMVPLPSSDDTERLNAPTGRWKDDLFGCLSKGLYHPTKGLCHASLLCACCCPEILMGQVMTRMSLNWCGKPVSKAASKETFKIVCILAFLYFIFNFLNDMGLSVLLFMYLLAFWAKYALCQTRISVRNQYSIPGSQMEDCICATCCTCCTVSQLARHTGEYETYPGICLSSTGHPVGTPMTV